MIILECQRRDCSWPDCAIATGNCSRPLERKVGTTMYDTLIKFGIFAVLAFVVCVIVAFFLHVTAAHAHQAGPLMPPGVVAQALPPPNAPAQDPKQPLGWTYGWECCSKMDCAELDDAAVHETPDGYVIDGSTDDAPVSYTDPKRIKQSHDEHFHWCAHRSGPDMNKTICIYTPSKGY